MSDITIAIVFKDEEKLLAHCLKALAASISRSEATPPQVFLIDNDSRDQSLVIAEDWQKDHKDIPVKIVKRSLNHMGQARQQAVDLAETPWLAFIDADCMVPKDWYTNAAKICESQPASVAGVGGPSPYKASHWLGHSATLLQGLAPWGMATHETTQLVHLPTCNIIYRRSAVIAVGGFDAGFSRVGEDLLLSHKLSQFGYQLKMYPQLKIQHIFRDSYVSWFGKMFRYGCAQSRLVKKVGTHGALNRFLPLFFLMTATFFAITNGLATSWVAITSYAISIVAVSLYKKDLALAFVAPILVIVSVLAYGLGELVAFLELPTPGPTLKIRRNV